MPPEHLLALDLGTSSVRAGVEGLAQRCVDLCEALPLGDGPLRVDGGLARSDLLMHVLADLLGRDLLRAHELETTALGVAFLAGVATHLIEGPESLHDRIAEPGCFAPRSSQSWRIQQRAAWRRALARCTSA